MTIKDFGGRKFLLCVLITLLTFLLVLIGKLPAPEYLKIVFAIIGLYTGLNVYQKIKTTKDIEPIKE